MDENESKNEKITLTSLARRQKIASLVLLGKSIEEISLDLKISTATVKRDKQWIRDEAARWTDEQALGGFLIDCQKQIRTIEECIQNLKDMRTDPELQPWQKLHLERTIVDISTRKLEVLDRMPMYHKLTNFMKKQSSSNIATE